MPHPTITCALCGGRFPEPSGPPTPEAPQFFYYPFGNGGDVAGIYRVLRYPVQGDWTGRIFFGNLELAKELPAVESMPGGRSLLICPVCTTQHNLT